MEKKEKTEHEHLEKKQMFISKYGRRTFTPTLNSHHLALCQNILKLVNNYLYIFSVSLSPHPPKMFMYNSNRYIIYWLNETRRK